MSLLHSIHLLLFNRTVTLCADGLCVGGENLYCLFIYKVAIATDVRKILLSPACALAQGLILIDSAMDSLSRQRHQSDDIYCWSNAYIPQANSLPHQSPHDDSASNRAKEHSKAQKVQGKYGISNGVGGRRGIFVWEDHVATHYLHNFYTISARRTFPTHS